MKSILVVVTALFSFLCAARAGETEEKDFESRLMAFAKAADMALADTIYVRGDTPQKETLVTRNHLEAVVVRRIKKVTFEDIFPRIKERLTSPVEIDRQKYLPNLVPYRMVAIEYEVPIKNGSSGYSALTGFLDGRLFIMGHKRVSE